MTVLIVDDHENMCWILSKILAEAGFEVETANCATEAMIRLGNREICAAIIDYRLPDRDGLALFEAMRKQVPELPGILVTSYGSSSLRQTALNRGFYAYLDKPFSNSILVTHLKEMIGCKS